MSAWTKRLSKVVVASVVAGAGVVGSTATANASGTIWVNHTTGNGVGIYSQANASSAKVDSDLPPWEGAVQIDCWVVGGQVGTAGDVWYRTWGASYPNGAFDAYNPAWTFAPYVDGAAAFHNGLQRC